MFLTGVANPDSKIIGIIRTNAYTITCCMLLEIAEIDNPINLAQAERNVQEKEENLADLIEGATELEIKNKQIEDLNKAIWYLVDEIHRLGGRCTVKTDSINTCLPIDNESIIDAVMNYSKVVDGTCKTLLGVGGNNDECRGILRRTIEDHIDYWYRVQKDGGQTKLDM